MTRYPGWTAGMLRRELSVRAERLARAQGLLHNVTTGASPSVVFGRDEAGRHGNFHPEAYAAICARPEWARRLTKVHTASRRSRARKDWQWMELDAANSSDALLMNVFCSPGVFDGVQLDAKVARMLGVSRDAQPCFGEHPGVPLKRGLLDRTEIDLTLGELFVEAKLTESDFQTAAMSRLQRYRDLETVFAVTRLPRTKAPVGAPIPEDDSWLNIARRPFVQRVQGYQLVRNVLAAYAAGKSFCMLCDARRHDLIEVWFAVLAAVIVPDFTWRLKLLTWQELAGVLPAHLQDFLDTKYGIQS